MGKLEIENTKKTPKVSLNPAGKLKISGRSIPEDPSQFYVQILNWVKEYCKSPAINTQIDIELEYFNSGTSKYILVILKELKEIYDNGAKVQINWFYEVGDDDILERGEYYSAILNMPLNYIQIDYE